MRSSSGDQRTARVARSRVHGDPRCGKRYDRLAVARLASARRASRLDRRVELAAHFAVQARVVDRDSRLRGEAFHEPLGALTEDAAFGVTEKKPAEDFA